MSLTVLVVIVVVGIAAVVVSVHFTGGTREAVLADADAACARFAEDFPGEPVRSVVLTRSDDAAFLELDAGRTGIVRAVGNHFLTRIVAPSDIRRVETGGEAGIVIELQDFTWKGGRFEFSDKADAWRVAKRLSPADPRNEDRKIA